MYNIVLDVYQPIHLYEVGQVTRKYRHERQDSYIF